MSESLGSAVLDLGVDDSGLDEGMSSAESTTESRMGKIGGVIAKGAAVAGAALVAVGAAAITGAFKTAAYGDELDKTSARMGVHTDFLQDMRFWASQNGIEVGRLDSMMARFNREIGNAADGTGKSAEAFEALGVSVRDANGDLRSNEDIFRDTVGALEAIEDPAAQAAAAHDLFGRAAIDLLPALRDGSLTLEEATAAMDDMGRMTEEQIAQAVKFTDSWDKVKTSAMSVLRDGLTPVMGFLADRIFPFVQERVIPALQAFGQWLGPKLQEAAATVTAAFDTHVMPILERLSGWWDEHGPSIIAHAQRIGGFIGDNLVPILAGLGAVMATAVIPIVGALIGMLGALFSPVVLVVGGLALLVGALVAAYQRSETFRKIVNKAFQTVSKFVSSAMDTISKVVQSVTKAVQAFWAKWGDNLTKFAQGTWRNIQSLIQGVMNIVRGIIRTVTSLIRGDWSGAWQGIRQIAAGVWQAIRALISQALNVIRNLFPIARAAITAAWSALWSAVRSRASSAMASLRSAISSGLNSVLGFFRSLPGRAAAAVAGLGAALFNAGRRAIAQLASGIRSMISAPVDAVRGVVQRVRNFLPFSPAKEGPLSGSGSPELAGERIAEMIAGGIESVRLDGAMRHLLSPAAAGGAGTTVVLQVDGRTLAQALGSGLVREVRLRGVGG